MIKRRPAGSLYIISQDDIETIGCLFESLHLAISQILNHRKLDDPQEGREEYSAVLHFDDQIQSIIMEEEF